jgi:uncharacterized protein YbjT (DUF2867 family)
MYLITGVTGHIGSMVARDLLNKGKKVRVVSRHGLKMKGFVDSGAEVLIGDLNNERFVNKAFEGISAAFCILPPSNLSEDLRKERQRISHNYTDAVRNNGTKHVILLSSIGAHLREGVGSVDGLADMEMFFSHLKNINILNLRAGYFMENLFFQLDMIKSSGIIGSTIKGDLKFPIVATKDIAAVVTKRLLSLDFSGNSIEYVLGPKDLSFNEIAKIIGTEVGRPDLKYVQFSDKDYKKGLIQSGYISENVVDSLIKMEGAFNSGRALNAHTRTAENSTPTNLEEFAKDLAYAYQHQPAA